MMKRLFSRKRNSSLLTLLSDTTTIRPSSGAQPSATTTAAPVGGVAQLPVSTNLYWKKSHKELQYCFGDDEEHPQFLSILYTGWHKGRPRWTLYDGLDAKKASKLAVAEKSGVKLQHATITVYLSDYSSSNEPIVRQMMSHHVPNRETRFTFSFPTPPSKGTDRSDQEPGDEDGEESYEWRHSRASDGRSQADWGWKLLRLSRAQADETRVLPDGEELVAFWADHNQQRTNRVAALRLFGSGASGELGDAFRVMVYISALGLFDTTHDLSFAAPVGGTSGASLAAGAGAG